MPLEQEFSEFSFAKNSLVTIGVFDGVHLGHKHLLAQLKKYARQQDMLSIAVTFDRHPQEILAPDSQPPFLTDIKEKARLLKNEGVDAVIVLAFNTELARTGAREFIEILQKRLNMRGLVVGPDFALGRNNEGNIARLRLLGQEMGFSVTVIPPVMKNGDVISSTAIRRSLAEGDLEKARRMLGRPFSLHGKVVHGKGRGAALGFPTVNLDVSPGQAVPGDGVYATRAFVEEQSFPSVTNIGKNPTFENSERTIESYLLDYQNNLYECDIRLEFIRKIRDEIKFDNIEALKKQIAEDIKVARSILNIEASVG